MLTAGWRLGRRLFLWQARRYVTYTMMVAEEVVKSDQIPTYLGHKFHD